MQKTAHIKERLAEYQQRYHQALSITHGHISPQDHLKAQQHLWYQTSGAEHRAQLPNLRPVTLHELVDRRNRYLGQRVRQSKVDYSASEDGPPASWLVAKGATQLESRLVRPAEALKKVPLTDILHREGHLPLPSGVRAAGLAPETVKRYDGLLRKAAQISSRSAETVQWKDLHHAVSNVWRLVSTMKHPPEHLGEASLEDHAELHRQTSAAKIAAAEKSKQSGHRGAPAEPTLATGHHPTSPAMSGRHTVTGVVDHLTTSTSRQTMTKRKRQEFVHDDSSTQSLSDRIRFGHPAERIPLKAFLDTKEPLPFPVSAHPHRAQPAVLERYQHRLSASIASSSHTSDSVERQHLSQAMSRIWRLSKLHPDPPEKGARRKEPTLEFHATQQNARAERNRL